MAKIAIIDEDRQIRSRICAEFERVGHKVRCAGDGAEGVALVTEWAPDVVCSDVDLPTMSGFQMLEALKAAGVDELTTRFVFMSDQTEEGVMADALMLGASHYVTKPIDFARLHAVVGDVSSQN